MKSLIDLDIVNPKLYSGRVTNQEKKLYPYYAGYASTFAAQMISALDLPKGANILDPWNGGGTTTLAANSAGIDSIGIDVNPAMVIVAKASYAEIESLSAIEKISNKIFEMSKISSCLVESDELLLTWLYPNSCQNVRRLENSINRYFLKSKKHVNLLNDISLSKLSPLGAFFYLVLFRVVRKLLERFIPSNPTWVKVPKHASARCRPSAERIEYLFKSETKELAARIFSEKINATCTDAQTEIILGNSEKLNINEKSVDAIISSPPYCTRIDYAVATSIELAVLRITKDAFDEVRRTFMGASTVPVVVPELNIKWGRTCNIFLKNVYNHTSKASSGYYYKSHLSYFSSLFLSISEISRVLKPMGVCILVIQDSYYKEIRNDVAKIASEMAGNCGLHLVRKKDFSSGLSMAAINSKAKTYLSDRVTTESVLIFGKT